MGNLKERLESGELEALHAQVDDLKAAGRQARDDATAALDLVSRIRMALNDNGKRMQDELLIYCRELAELPPRVAELEAWQLAIAEGTQFINRAEGQDGYEVADPQTILKHFEEEAHERDRYQEALTVIYTNEDPESPARMTAFLALNPKR